MPKKLDKQIRDAVVQDRDFVKSITKVDEGLYRCNMRKKCPVDCKHKGIHYKTQYCNDKCYVFSDSKCVC